MNRLEGDTKVTENKDLTALKLLLSNQHGEVAFNNSMSVARIERELIDSITSFRKHRKITQKDLASNINIKAQQLSKYERLEQVPSMSALIKLCEALGIELSLKSKENETVIFHT
jgi:ribosome-binding protein aMBF1 (putative translation factor)